MAVPDSEQLDWRRSTMSWKARFADDCVLSSVGDEKREVVVSQAPSAGRQHGQRDGDGAVDPGVTGSTVWDGAVVLAQHLSRSSSWSRLCARLTQPPSLVVELGAGCGLAGLAIAVSGALHQHTRVLLTDLEAVVPLLQRNTERNPRAAGVVAVAALRWGDVDSAIAAMAPAAAADVVVGADLVYRQPNVQPLLAALSQTLRVGGVAVFALDLQHCPEAVDDFIARAKQPDAERDAVARYDVRQVTANELPQGYACSDVCVVELWRLS